MEEDSSVTHLSTKRTQTRVVQMSKLEKYFHYKSLMMEHSAFAVANQSLEDSLYHLICYHLYKDFCQKEYLEMSHNDRETLHTLMIL